MKHWLKSRILAASSALALTLAGAGIATAETTISGLVHFTKVDTGYFVLDEMYKRFKEQHPDITINWDFLDHDAYHTKMQALAISNTLPDLMTLWPGKRTGYLTDQGYATDLRPLIERDNLAASQNDILLGPQGKNGEVYGLEAPLV